MKLFLIVFFIIYGGLSLYGGMRWIGTLPSGYLRSGLASFSAFFALSYPLGRFLSHSISPYIWIPMIHMGEFWLALLPHLVIPALIWDLYRLLLVAFKKAPGPRVNPRLFLIWTTVFTIVFIGGSLNAKFPAVKTLDLNLSRENSAGEKLKAVLITDLHIGPVTSTAWVRKLVDSVNTMSPDVIFIGGDIIDPPDSQCLIENAQELGRLRAPMGVYASPGNHEYYLGIDRAQSILKDAGIPLLRDDRILIGDMVWLVGREDMQAPSMGYARSPLKKLMPHDGRPVIVLDHTPLALEEASSAGADLLLCGHSHNGQLFPFNFITSLIYNPDWGLRTIGKTAVYVSCGAGTWGPPIRTSSRPEIVVLNLRF